MALGLGLVGLGLGLGLELELGLALALVLSHITRHTSTEAHKNSAHKHTKHTRIVWFCEGQEVWVF